MFKCEVECEFYESRTDAPSGQLFGNFRMHKDDDTIFEAIFHKSRLSLYYNLKLLSLFVVNDFEWLHKSNICVIFVQYPLKSRKLFAILH